MSEPKMLTVVAVEEKRDVVPVRGATDPNHPFGGEDLDFGYSELAIGHTRNVLFVRTASGKVYALDAPAELAEELRK